MARKRKKKPPRKPPAAEPAAEPAQPRAPRLDEEPPKGPWGSFPLTELTVLAGLILLVLGLITGSMTQLVLGLLLGSAGGLELSIREHFAGYRSHTTLLAGVVFVVSTGVAYFLAELVLWQALAIGVALLVLSFWLLRRTFQNATGGLSYRLR
jgi:hypothetical protein